jgi:peptide/nickel transport system permease protein
MFQLLIKRLAYGVLVLAGVVVVVFFIFQAFGDPARMVLGQTGDKQTMDNIRKELYLDQPKWKQFVFYVNDISPISIDTKEEIIQKDLHGFFISIEGNEK